ncbi:hypothetical protein IMSHALPRED_002002 [Imshaugia aleurites]|uniref:Uncharacterized protein n=1 Tax=Imshaugia aleurites TaxID=172621 RepID=A0A8H3J439_9LECA|nr:hypothetical protein IMSHALPRED_002002 [Imshaugia aleurites]
MASPPKIAIIGAGPSGLTLARLLHVSEAKVDLTLYELDASPTSRADQGGAHHVHVGGGGEKTGAFDWPEIDRERLKEMLLESVPEECVRWG